MYLFNRHKEVFLRISIKLINVFIIIDVLLFYVCVCVCVCVCVFKIINAKTVMSLD